MLKSCARAPAALEVLLNGYPQLRVSESWQEAIPEEEFQVRGCPSAPVSVCSPRGRLRCEPGEAGGTSGFPLEAQQSRSPEPGVVGGLLGARSRRRRALA